MAALLPGRTETAICQRAMGMGIAKSHESRSASSRRSFLALCERRGAKPGMQPRPVGATHKKGRYTMVKVAQPDVWKPLHIHTWEEANGPVPEGMQVWAKDGNPRNVALENLTLSTLAEIHLRTNFNYRGLPDEVLDILHLQNEIKKTIKRKRRNEK
ncbi:HNH endonuclease signature motif containing protein [Pseudomonas sp. LS-2]|uniref:HNH endonuclease signature motif containing protein n=1 Tax=Pseudomonas sp. LS-2 TaxID=2315859 RepID=UPI000E76B7FD|nr:HNH endonuclease signature motif containing protein [Pseudomonas sp. LS-2]RJX81298.1 HNH endonuclease [Pseudomonas sp. LS-2]